MMVGDEMRLSGTCGHVLEIALLAAVPLVMGAALLTGAANAALLMMVVVTLVLVLFFLGYERSQPALRQIMPTLVLAALAEIAERTSPRCARRAPAIRANNVDLPQPLPPTRACTSP